MKKPELDYVYSQHRWLELNKDRDLAKEMIDKLTELDPAQQNAFVAGFFASAIKNVASEGDTPKRRLNQILVSVGIAPLKDY